jgi:hypothetical protein
MSAHDFLLVAPLSLISDPQIIFHGLFAIKLRTKRKVPIRSAKEVPALASVRALVSAAQLEIFVREPAATTRSVGFTSRERMNNFR